MKIIKADNSGACYGVCRALDLACEAASSSAGEVYTLGELIHNPGVVAHLEQQGVHVAMHINDIQGGTVVIRSHGATPAVLKQLQLRGLAIVDATCPHVFRAQRAAEELARKGCHVIVVGEEGHPEVEGIKTHALEAGAEVSVVASGAEVPPNLDGPVGVVVQTTQPEEKLEEVIQVLRVQGIEPEVKNTICSATRLRQNEARSLATRADVMVVIGGHNSSNTTRLAEICHAQCFCTYHIESAAELRPAFFEGAEVVGVTAGASTPESQVDEVLRYLEGLKKYESVHMPCEPVAVVSAVEPGSVAYEAGFEKGCMLTALDGVPIRDLIDWRWRSAQDSMSVSYIDNDGDSGTITLTREDGRPWGFEFDQLVFDGVATCRNACSFCFMRQLPPDLRPSLYMRDDDYRLSFLSGTFVTLTNVTAEDEARIVAQQISPLHVSLHAVDAKVRTCLIGRHAQVGFEVLQRLLTAGIKVHAQIVLVPGVNDGDVLRETLNWAYEQAGILTVGVVPLGYTRYQDVFAQGFDRPEQAAEVLQLLEPFQRRARMHLGHVWVYAADEFYLTAYGEQVIDKLPSAAFYGAFDLFEDGIGIVRSTLDEWERAKDSGLLMRVGEHLAHEKMHVVMVAGCAQQPYLSTLMNDAALRGRLAALYVKNNFFGGNVDVTGLLCGCDIVASLQAFECEQTDSLVVALPRVIFNDDGLTLDGMTIDDMTDAVGLSLAVVSCSPNAYLEELLHMTRPAGKERD